MPHATITASGDGRDDHVAARSPTSRRRRCLQPPRDVVWAVSALVVAIAAVGSAAVAEPLPPLDIVAPPPAVTAQEAAAHVDDVVVLETAIASGRFADGRVVLQPVGDGAAQLRIVLVPPLLGMPGRQLADRYTGHRVRVLGRVREFAGAYEIFSTDPDAIEIVDAAPPPPPPAAITLDAAPAPPPAAASTTSAAAAEPAVTPTARPAATVPAGDATPPDPCSAARRDWATAAASARPLLERLERCLAARVPACIDELTAARSGLAEVAAGAERIQWQCGRGS